MAATPSTHQLTLGSAAPPFLLPDASGALHRLENLRGPAGLVVAFVCNHCPYVVHLAHEIGRLAEEARAMGVGFVAINSNDASRYPADAPDKMPPFANASGWSFPYLIDEAQTTAKAYAAACTPDFFVFDKGLYLTYAGQFDDSRPGNGKQVTGEELRRAIQAAATGAPPLPKQRPSIGCNIKWKPGNEPAYFG